MFVEKENSNYESLRQIAKRINCLEVIDPEKGINLLDLAVNMVEKLPIMDFFNDGDKVIILFTCNALPARKVEIGPRALAVTSSSGVSLRDVDLKFHGRGIKRITQFLKELSTKVAGMNLYDVD